MDDENTYKLSIPFGIDDGELDGLNVQDAFVRGFQVGAIWAAASAAARPDAEEFRMIIHSDNADRCERFAKARGCKYERRWLNDDWVEFMLIKEATP